MKTVFKHDAINQSNFDSLVAGELVTFSKVPCGSYLKTHEAYIVEWKSDNAVYFRDPRNGGGTYDSRIDVNMGVIVDVEV